MKAGRVVGFDDGYFERGRHARAPLVGCVMKGEVIEGFRMGCIEVDGSDATDVISSLLPDVEQFSAVFLYGSVFGGTNVVDVQRLYAQLKKPIIVVSEDVPEEEKIRRSFLSRRREDSLQILLKNPPLQRMETKRGTLYVGFIGLSFGEARRIVEIYQMSGKVPEPLRISHLVAKEAGRWLRNC